MWYNKGMTTAEVTISMVNRLTEPEMLEVQKYIKRIFAFRGNGAGTLKRYNEREFVDLIDESIEQSKKGDVYSWADIRRVVHGESAV